MTTACQRWRERRDSYRPAGEPIDTSRYGVEVVEERDAKRFVIAHHYSASMVAARVCVGLYRSRAWITPELVGVAVFSVPAPTRTPSSSAWSATWATPSGRASSSPTSTRPSTTASRARHDRQPRQRLRLNME